MQTPETIEREDIKDILQELHPRNWTAWMLFSLLMLLAIAGFLLSQVGENYEEYEVGLDNIIDGIGLFLSIFFLGICSKKQYGSFRWSMVLVPSLVFIFLLWEILKDYGETIPAGENSLLAIFLFFCEIHMVFFAGYFFVRPEKVLLIDPQGRHRFEGLSFFSRFLDFLFTWSFLFIVISINTGPDPWGLGMILFLLFLVAANRLANPPTSVLTLRPDEDQRKKLLEKRSWVEADKLAMSSDLTLQELLWLRSEDFRLLITSGKQKHARDLKRLGYSVFLLQLEESTIPTLKQIDDFHKRIQGTKATVLFHAPADRPWTGVLLAAYLIKSEGLSVEEAVARVREIRPHSVETSSQLDMLERYVEYLVELGVWE